jgi:hypothetical protein
MAAPLSSSAKNGVVGDKLHHHLQICGAAISPEFLLFQGQRTPGILVSDFVPHQTDAKYRRTVNPLARILEAILYLEKQRHDHPNGRDDLSGRGKTGKFPGHISTVRQTQCKMITASI